MQIGGETVAYAVLGHPVDHSLSPVMHNAAFRELQQDAAYLAFDVQPRDAGAAITACGKMGFGGLNITVPLKKLAIDAITELDTSAQLMGVVNTVAFHDTAPVGYNTDGYGFLEAIREAFGITPEDKSIYIAGAGGAGRAVALMCASEGATCIILADMDKARSRDVAKDITDRYQHVEVKQGLPPETRDFIAAADLVIQATPLGLKAGDPSPIDAGDFRSGQYAFDLVYTCPETAFMKAARQAGADAANGLGMLLHQGARAFEIWTGLKAPIEVMRSTLESAVYGT